MSSPNLRPTSAAKELPLDRPLPLPDLARHCGVTTHYLRRWVMQLQKKHPEDRILIRVGERWMVPSLSVLRKHWPDFGKKFFTADEVERLVDENKQLRRDMRALAARVRKVEQLASNLAKVVLRDTVVGNDADVENEAPEAAAG